MAPPRKQRYVRKRRSPVDAKYGTIAKTGVPVLKTLQGRDTFYDPQLNAMYAYFKASQHQMNQQRNLFKGLNLSSDLDQYLFPENAYTPSTDSSDGDGQSAFGWVVDKLSRPLYAVAEGSKDFSQEFTDVIRGGNLENQIRDVGDMFAAGAKGAYQGASGNADTIFANVLRDEGANPISAGWGLGIKKATGVTPPGTTPQWWQDHPKTAAAVGLTGDIVLDPSTYVGLGLVGKAGTGARLFKDQAAVDKAVTGLSAFVKDYEKAGKIGALDAQRFKDLFTSRKFRMGFQGQKGAQAMEGRVAQLVRDIADDKALFTKNRVFNDTLDNLKKLNTYEKLSAGGIKMRYPGALRDRQGKMLSLTNIASKASDDAADQVAELTLKSAMDQYRTIVTADYKKTLGLGTTRYKIPILPARATEELAKIAQLKPLQIAADKSRTLLQNSYKVIDDVYRVKVEAMSLGRSATYTVGRYLDRTFRQIGSDERKATYLMGLRKERSNMDITVKPPGSKETRDAAEVFDTHVARLSDRVNGEFGELPFSPAELNRMLPPGLPKIFGKEKMETIGRREGLINPETGKVYKGQKQKLLEMYQNQDWFRYSLLRSATDSNIKGMKDGGHALWIATASVEHAAARRAMLDNLADAFGFSKTLGKNDKVAGILLKDLTGKRGFTEAKGIKDLQDIVFNPEVAEGITKMLKTMDDQREWNTFLKYLNRITGPWKFWVTQPNPGYHIRNIMGDAFINWIDGAILPQDYNAAARMLGWRFKGMEKFENVDEMNSALLRLGGDPMRNALHVRNKPLFKNAGHLRDAEGNIKPFVLDSELYAGMNKHGIRQNYAVSQFGELENEINTFGTPFTNAFRRAGEPFRRVSEWREDYMRLAHFIHLVKKNPSKARTLDEAMEWAANRVRMTHFDYTDFTKFEQQVLSNVIPFYKWTRKALPLMARFMFEHPGKVIIPEKITKNLSAAFGYYPGEERPLPGMEDRFVPDWLIAGGYQPTFSIGDNPIYQRYPSPFSDVLAFQGNDITSNPTPAGFGDMIMSQTNPLIRIPYEMATNHQTLFAGEDVPIYGEGGTGMGQYATQQLPVPFMNQVLKQRGTFTEGEGNWGPALTNLTGMYSRELTPRDERNALLAKLFSGKLNKYENANIRRILKEQFGVEY